MKIVSSLTLVVAVGWILGCSSVPDPQVINVPLNATSTNAGSIAQTTMMPNGSGTMFWFAVKGKTMGSTLPGRLEAYIYPGSCASLGSKPAFDLNDGPNARFYSPSSLQYFYKSAPVAVDTLRTGGYALVVCENPADGNQNAFCGNLS